MVFSKNNKNKSWNKLSLHDSKLPWMLCQSDLVIVGAGPAGCTLALKMAPTGRSITILDKDLSPRDKICGDALSGKVNNILKRLPDNIYSDFLAQVPKIQSQGIRFVAPNLQMADVPFPGYTGEPNEAPGYVCRRLEFDRFLFQRMHRYPNIRIMEGKTLTGIIDNRDGIIATTGEDEFRCQVLAGADGVHSIVRRTFHTAPVEKKHFCIGIRSYFSGVTGLHPEHFIELIFLKELLPGYFWIFPGEGDRANVGFGMLQSTISARKINLITLFRELIASHPLLAPRFSRAVMLGKPEAHSLPLGSFNMPRSGRRTLLLGDAAFLVDPFSGEGIGNAMASGEIAGEILTGCFERNDFSDQALHAYDARIARRFGTEFRTATIMQRLSKHPALINLVVNKARKNTDVNSLLSAMFTSDDIRKKLTRIRFYTGLILK
jgi:geranylgeranyl reductase family protein